MVGKHSSIDLDACGLAACILLRAASIFFSGMFMSATSDAHETCLVCLREGSHPCCGEPFGRLLLECLPLLVAHVVFALRGWIHGDDVIVGEEGPRGVRGGVPISLDDCTLYLQPLGLDLHLPKPSVKLGDHLCGR